jgi:hypothetical protein
LARSGNQCAYPGCSHPIVNEKNQFVAQVCHIAAASLGGERYAPKMTDEERRGYDNLILLCYRHHVETNDTAVYDAAAMQRMKANHESQFKESPYQPSEQAVAAITREAAAYWRDVRRRNREQSSFPEDIRMEIDVEADADKLLHEIREMLRRLHNVHEHLSHSADSLPHDVRTCLEKLGCDLRAWDDLPYWENPTINRDWEELTLGLNNFMQGIRVLIDQLEIRFLEAALVASPRSSDVQTKLDRCRRRLLKYAAHLGYID